MPQQIQDEWEDLEWEDVDESSPIPPVPPSRVVSPTIPSTATSRVTAPPQSESMLGRAWNAITTPLTDAPSRFARSVAGIEAPTEGGIMDAIGALPDIGRNLINEPMATIKGFGQGILEGIGNLATEQTSPLGIATTALPALRPVRKGISSLANRILGKVDDIPLPAGPLPSPPKTEGPITFATKAEADLAAPSSPVRPMFNPRGQTGMTGTAQTTPKAPVNVWLKNPTPEKVKQAAEQGYKFGGKVREDGAFSMVKSETPLDVPMLESEVGITRPTKGAHQQQLKHQLGPVADVKKQSAIAEAINFPRGVMASWDFSAPLRQGVPLIGKKAWWTSFDDMFKSWGSENAFQAVQKSIAEKPLFRPRVGPGNKQLPSFADDAGLKLTDLTDLSKREEAVMSTWAEKVPGVRRSNRAYVAFLNKLRADTFEDLIKKGKVLGADGEANIPLAREIANFVNTSTGRGSLGSLEQSAVALNSTFFSPRLIASRLTMLNPHYYWSASPMVRKEALKALLSVATVGSTIGQLGRMAGGTVESDPTSSDFGKIKIGNTRIDPYAGFQQYVVLANRLLQGRTKSSISGREYNLGEEFGRPTRLDVLGRFAEGKLHPVLSFATGLLRGKDFTGQPFDVPQELANRVMPIIVQDIIELANEDPKLLPLAIPASLGMGIQSYESQ